MNSYAPRLSEKMKLYWANLILASLIVGCALAKLSLAADDDVHQAPVQIRKFELKKLFDYQTYVKLYGKHYQSPAEWINRARLFFARVYKVFIQGLKYLHREDDKYFAINEMSDWTLEERQSSNGFKPEKKELTESDKELLTSIRRESAEHMKKREADKLRRNKREVKEQSHERHLRPENLMRDPSKFVERPSPKLVHDPSSLGKTEPQVEYGPEVGARATGPESIPEETISSNKLILNSLVDKFWSEHWYDRGRSELIDPGSNERSASGEAPNLAAEVDEVYLDYRKSGCIPPVKRQYQCGSCYVFSMIALYEYEHCKQTGKLVEFSEQYPLDCGSEMGGCKGGRCDSVVLYVKLFGLEPKDYYPYKGKVQTCPYARSSEHRSMGHTRVAENNSAGEVLAEFLTDAMIEYLLETHGPMSIAIRVKDEFHDYGGGVERLGDFESDFLHAMVLIGHGREDGREYWLIRNSHGLHWGEEGHYKLDKKFNWKQLYGIVMIKDTIFETNPHYDAEKTKQALYKNAPITDKLFSWIAG